MEVVGTPLGGGALKLEATHLRHMLVPLFTHDARVALHEAGKCLHRNSQEIQARIDRIVLQAIFPRNSTGSMLSDVAVHIAVQTRMLCAARKKTAS